MEKLATLSGTEWLATLLVERAMELNEEDTMAKLTARSSYLARRKVSPFLESIFINQAALNGTRPVTPRCRAGADP